MADVLKSMGAAWFVSYYYHKHCDSGHMAWNSSVIKTINRRIGWFNNSVNFHKCWLSDITLMSESRLDANKLGLSGAEINKMAIEALKV